MDGAAQSYEAYWGPPGESSLERAARIEEAEQERAKTDSPGRAAGNAEARRSVAWGPQSDLSGRVSIRYVYVCLEDMDTFIFLLITSPD